MNEQNYRYYYFAYGSNMNRERMRTRCPEAREVGPGVLEGWVLRERLYADIDRDGRGRVGGVVYELTMDDILSLDRCEGYPRVYTDVGVSVRLGDGRSVKCLAYKMTPTAVAMRAGVPYPEWYRQICFEGARRAGVRNQFTVRRAG